MNFPTQLRRIRRTTRLAATVIALLPSMAAADFGARFGVSPADQTVLQNSPLVSHPSFGYLPTWQLFVDPDTRVQTRSRSPLGALGPTQTISPAGGDATDVHVAVDANGNTSYVWAFDNGVDSRIQTRDRSAGGALGPVATLSPPGQTCSEPRVAVRPAGRKVFTWRCGGLGSQQVKLRTRSATGVLGATQNISPASGSASSAQVVAAGNGNALAVWLHYDGTLARVQARPLSNGDVLGPIENISPGGTDNDFPHVATTPGGKAVIVWQQYGSSFSESVIKVRNRLPSGALSPVVSLTAPGTQSVEPKAALDGAGDALVIWTLHDTPSARIQARHRSAAGVLGATQNISNAGIFAFDARVARNTDGAAVIVWTVEGGGRHRVQARSRADNGPLGPIQTLSNALYQTSFPRAQIALDDDGNAVASFSRYDGTNERIYVSAGP